MHKTVLLVSFVVALFLLVNTTSKEEDFLPLLALLGGGAAAGILGAGSKTPVVPDRGFAGAVVRMFEHKNFGGKGLHLHGAGQWPNLSTLTGIDNRDNMFSSAWVAPGHKLLFYMEPNFGGAVGEFGPGTYPYIGDYWNDKWSSLKVIKI